MTTLLFYSEENGLVIVCPQLDPAAEPEVGGAFWPVFHGGGFCGVSYAELRAAGKGTLDVDEYGRARIGS